MNWNELELETAREVLKADFSEFVKDLWSHFVPEKLVWANHMDVLCQEMQAVGERILRWDEDEKNDDLIINVPPGTSKTSIVNLLFPAWLWTRNPSLRFMCISYSHMLSQALSAKARDILKTERYQQLFPNVKIRRDSDSKTLFKLTGGGERFTTSTGSTATGLHAHLILIDDPINSAEVQTPNLMNAVNDWLSSYLSTRKVCKARTATVMIMQRLSVNDPTAYLIERSSHIRHVCLPAELTSDVKPVEYRKIYRDGLLDPTRMSEKILEKQKDRMGEMQYAGQFLQKPVARGGNLFKIDKLITLSINPHTIKKEIRGWDKASTINKHADYTASCKMGKLANGQYIILDVMRGKWEIHERELTIRKTADIDNASVEIVIEKPAGEGGLQSAQNTVANLAGYKVNMVYPSGSKTDRAERFATQVNAGNVFMLKADWNTMFLDELGAFPNGKHDDMVDAAVIAFNQLHTVKRVGTWS